MTIKLYWNDSHLTRFTARVADSWEQDGDRVLVLDRTAFYPTGGGQPCDLGRIKGSQVIDVQFDEGERILHRLAAGASYAIGEGVECEIDWSRRLELMQQHTGQHILSQAFFQLFGAETNGFRITDDSTEIDLTIEVRPEEAEAAMVRAEELANRIVFENREIRVHEVSPDEAAKLPLRKESFIADCVRVIEIEGYDWSPCGGTHAGRTGEVGLIAIRQWERAKKMTRVHFLCGVRALRDYRAANQAAQSIAGLLSSGRAEAPAAVAKLIDDNRRLNRRVRELAELAATAEAEELIDGANSTNGVLVISRIFDGRDLDELKLLAHRLVDRQNVIALLASRGADAARMVFARSANLSADMSAMMKTACESLEGRGGGKPDFAQGGGSKADHLEDAMRLIQSRLESQVN